MSDRQQAKSKRWTGDGRWTAGGQRHKMMVLPVQYWWVGERLAGWQRDGDRCSCGRGRRKQQAAGGRGESAGGLGRQTCGQALQKSMLVGKRTGDTCGKEMRKRRMADGGGCWLIWWSGIIGAPDSGRRRRPTWRCEETAMGARAAFLAGEVGNGRSGR